MNTNIAQLGEPMAVESVVDSLFIENVRDLESTLGITSNGIFELITVLAESSTLAGFS